MSELRISDRGILVNSRKIMYRPVHVKAQPIATRATLVRGGLSRQQEEADRSENN